MKNIFTLEVMTVPPSYAALPVYEFRLYFLGLKIVTWQYDSFNQVWL
jgi:hypothetical protein